MLMGKIMGTGRHVKNRPWWQVGRRENHNNYYYGMSPEDEEEEEEWERQRIMNYDEGN